MKVSTALLKKINGEPVIKINEVVSGMIQQEITSGLIQQELTSGEVITNINQQIQEVKQKNDDLTDMLTFK